MGNEDRKREAYNYRVAYFQRNPGLFGCIWFCSQCGIPMIGKNNVQVDHIIPLAGLGINRTINTVAICPHCNREKSDKCGKYAIKGNIAKVLEVVLFTLQKVVLHTFVFLARILHFVLSTLINLLIAIFEIANFGTRIVLIIIFVIILVFVFK